MHFIKIIQNYSEDCEQSPSSTVNRYQINILDFTMVNNEIARLIHNRCVEYGVWIYMELNVLK